MPRRKQSQPPPSVTLPQPSAPTNRQNPSAMSSSPLSPASPASPTSRSFFGAITERVRSGRSRSRSPAPSAQTSPVGPETKAQWQSQASDTVPDRPQGGRTFSNSTSGSAGMERTTSTGSADRSQWNSISYGRHSSEWLFKSQKTLKRQSTSDSNAS